MVLTIEAFIRTLLGQLSHPNSLGTARNSERAWVMIREADSPQDTLSGNVFKWLGNASQLTSEQGRGACSLPLSFLLAFLFQNQVPDIAGSQVSHSEVRDFISH